MANPDQLVVDRSADYFAGWVKISSDADEIYISPQDGHLSHSIGS